MLLTSGTFSWSSAIRLRFTDGDGGLLRDVAADKTSRCSSLGAAIKLGALWRLVVWSNVAGAGAAWHAQSREFFIEVRARSVRNITLTILMDNLLAQPKKWDVDESTTYQTPKFHRGALVGAPWGWDLAETLNFNIHWFRECRAVEYSPLLSGLNAIDPTNSPGRDLGNCHNIMWLCWTYDYSRYFSGFL